MKSSIRVSLSVFLLAALSLACAFTVDTGSGTTPTVISVTVTTTPGPTQSPQPSSTTGPQATSAEQPTATVVAATATSDVLHFYVSGYVWEDVCPYFDGPLPNPLPVGCILDPVDGLISDGIFSLGEPGIEGVTVRIEIDCNYGAFTAVTDASGFYTMSFTVPANAGVSDQRICLSIDATSADNADILIPGWWTSPKTNSDVAVIEITIPVEQPNTVNFGWDYEFD